MSIESFTFPKSIPGLPDRVLRRFLGDPEPFGFWVAPWGAIPLVGFFLPFFVGFLANPLSIWATTLAEEILVFALTFLLARVKNDWWWALVAIASFWTLGSIVSLAALKGVVSQWLPESGLGFQSKVALTLAGLCHLASMVALFVFYATHRRRICVLRLYLRCRPELEVEIRLKEETRRLRRTLEKQVPLAASPKPPSRSRL